jgi:hypothetical protein
MPPDFGGDGRRPAGNIGDPCVVGTGCSGAAECLEVGPGIGVCARKGCTPENVTTAKTEDDCPMLGTGPAAVRTVCTRISTGASASAYFCLPKCEPKPDANPCVGVVGARLACDPVSLLQNGWSEVCMLPACESDAECGNRNPISPDSTCDPATGTCQARGNAGVKIGAKCKTSADCGPKQFCYAERKDRDGKPMVEGGYCTIVGCGYGGPWACPADSKCVSMAKTFTMCLATGCVLAAPPGKDGCRDGTAAGQYKCIPQDTTSVCAPVLW